jgi:hypothetical protein
LGLAAIGAAGIDGLRKHLRLPEPIGKFISSLIIPDMKEAFMELLHLYFSF